MKKIYLIAAFAFLVSCGKEKREEIQKNLIMEAMTNGFWKVTSFIKGGTDITTDFSAYKFQFKDNLTVDAINGGSVEKTGTWNADANTYTITSNFSGAVNPLAYLNGTWTITSTTWTQVYANQTVSGELRTLRMDKL